MLSLLQTSILVFVAFSFMNVSSAAKKTMSKQQIEDYKKFSFTNVSVIGEYKKHDKEFVFLKVKGAKGLIKVNRKYLLNSPSFLTDGEKVSVNLPIGRHLLDNKEILMAKKN